LTLLSLAEQCKIKTALFETDKSCYAVDVPDRSGLANFQSGPSAMQMKWHYPDRLSSIWDKTPDI
jgi:hypothetical protein